MRTILVDDEGALDSAERSSLRAILRAAARELAVGPGDVVVRFVSESDMQALNREWRGFDKVTDVLSFPSGTLDPDGRRHIGDIAICAEVAQRQARRRRHSPFRESALLALHGLLHVLGYDHERDDGEMERLEAGLRRRHLPARAER